MVSVPGIFKDGKITLLQPILNVKEANVIVTVLEETSTNGEPKAIDSQGANWLGCMAHTLTGELGDIVSPMEETWNDWEVLRDEVSS